jgi:deoxycytidylate deaminase
VLVGRDKRDVAIGYNGFPSGIRDDYRLLDRIRKHQLTQHAERNVLDNAHFRAEGATLVATKFLCIECAKSIVSKRIARVVTKTADTEGVWAESSRLAAEMFDEAGVEVSFT